MKKIHMGNIIRKKVKEKRMNVTNFANALHCHRSNVYSIFDREIIDFHLLKIISDILGCDLLTEYRTNDPQLKYILLLEVDHLKMLEIQSDPLITVLYIKSV